MRIVDSPGVVFDDDDTNGGKGEGKGNILLRNVVKAEDVEDPIAVGEMDQYLFLQSGFDQIILTHSRRDTNPDGTRNNTQNLQPPRIHFNARVLDYVVNDHWKTLEGMVHSPLRVLHQPNHLNEGRNS